MSPKVALIQCSSYEDAAVQEAVHQAIDLLGGMDHYVQPGQRVLLKVNLLRAASPGSAVCTHPAVVKAVARLVQEVGGHPVIGDSPGGPFHPAWVHSVYALSGMSAVAEETGAELNRNFEETRLSHPQGRVLKALEVGAYVTSADVVISLPKLKTHGFMQLTGAVKNLFGVIPGLTKLSYHSKFPLPEQFAHVLVDIATLIRPALSLMDGIVAMDGDGPSGGDPFTAGALLVSTDPFALDAIAAALVGCDPRQVYTLGAALERDLLPARLEDIAVLGASLEACRVQGFRLPRTHPFSGRFRLLQNISRHWFVAAPQSNERCIGCGVCVRGCPVKAITLVDRRAQMDLKTCIRCYCCHEFCPERAIDLRRPWLGRLLS